MIRERTSSSPLLYITNISLLTHYSAHAESYCLRLYALCRRGDISKYYSTQFSPLIASDIYIIFDCLD